MHVPCTCSINELRSMPFYYGSPNQTHRRKASASKAYDILPRCLTGNSFAVAPAPENKREPFDGAGVGVTCLGPWRPDILTLRALAPLMAIVSSKV